MGQHEMLSLSVSGREERGMLAGDRMDGSLKPWEGWMEGWGPEARGSGEKPNPSIFTGDKGREVEGSSGALAAGFQQGETSGLHTLSPRAGKTPRDC